MNKALITDVNNRSIYLISNDKISFYVNMPSSKDVSIAINLVDNVNNINMGMNNVNAIKTEISNIYDNLIDLNTIVFITPVLDNNLMEQIKLNNNEKIFIYTDKIISYLINQTHGLLTEEDISVNNIIKLKNNLSYHEFNNWFVKKYNGRVELLNINNQYEQQYSEKESINNSEIRLADEVLENTNTLSPIKESNKEVNNTRDLGFVSYVLLGVVVAVISLVILYMLL